MSDSLLLMWLIDPEAAYIYIGIGAVVYLSLTAHRIIKERRRERQ